jgi:hypothetical protein
LPGATNAWLRLTNLQVSDAGNYLVVVTNALGAVTSKNASLFVAPGPVGLGPALSASNLIWTCGGDAPWFEETNTTHDGVAAAQSGRIGDSQQSSVQTAVAGPGVLSFWWKVSSEQWFDYLTFAINGSVQAAISGEIDWQSEQFDIPAGLSTLSWTYAKDPTLSVGLDSGWLDRVDFVTNPPAITVQPLSQVLWMGTNTYMTVGASGAPALSYQWYKDGTNLAGATWWSYFITNATRRDSGEYWATVSNPGGTTTSSNAQILVRVPQTIGSPTWSPQGGFTLLSRDADGSRLSSADLAGFSAQVSRDLVDWTSLSNVLSVTNGGLMLVDPRATNGPRGFYRVLEY